MKPLLFASLILFAFTAGCQTETRVIRDDTVGHKFAAFGKSGWGVSGGGLDLQRTAAQSHGTVLYDNSPNLFRAGEAQWSTNFQTDQPAPPPPNTPPPPSSTLDPVTGLPLAH